MNYIKRFFFIFSLIFSFHCSESQNICLDFDGDEDYIATTSGIGNGDFTIELWFRSTDYSTSCTNPIAGRALFAFGNSPWIIFVICNGIPYLYDGSTAIPLSINTYNDGQWHHLALTRSADNIACYIDCVNIYTGSIPSLSTMNITNFSLGRGLGSDYWKGQIDEVAISAYAKWPGEICANHHCTKSYYAATQLLMYWNFDEGTAAGNNQSIVNVPDLSGNGRNGIFSPYFLPVFSGFRLTGNTSNYENSNAQLAYPRLYNYHVEIRDYATQTIPLTTICHGDPVHFGLYRNGVLMNNSTTNVDVDWYFREGNNGLTALPANPYSEFAFGIPAGIILADCVGNTDGYTDRTYIAFGQVIEPISGDVCLERADTAQIRICCPIGPLTINMSPGGAVCEGDPLNLTLTLNSSDAFVCPPGPQVDIKWYVNNVHQPTFDDQCTMTYSGVAGSALCFTAEVSNCGGKIETTTTCLSIRLKPVCGTIDIWQTTPTYPLLLSPGVYEICPGDDTRLKSNPSYLNCIPTWQYSFDQIAWTDLGTSSTVQNTNIVPSTVPPTNWPPGQINIYYRIECLQPGGECPPCTSNIIELKLRPPLPPSSITGSNQVCRLTTNTLTYSVPPPTPPNNYQWLCNGAAVGPPNTPTLTYTAQQSACYEIEIDNGCDIIYSPKYCVTVCEVGAVLSCPKAPNDCACLGVPITLDASKSISNCGNSFQYKWYVDGVHQTSITTPTFTHTPPIGGATYKVEVTELTSGCTGVAVRTIIPCDKNN